MMHTSHGTATVFPQGTIKTTGRKAITQLESLVSEGFQTLQTFEHDNPVPLSTVSFAVGLSLTGLRTAIWMDQATFSKYLYQFASSIQRHLSYIVHLFSERKTQLPFMNLGGFCLSASTVQEAIDLSIIGHKLAELALLPGIHVLEPPIAETGQQVTYPDLEILHTFLGKSDDFIESPTEAQKLLFGTRRRRIPNWYSFDHSMLNGVFKDDQSIMLEAAAQQVYFTEQVPMLAEQIMLDYSQLVERTYSPISGYRLEDADYVVVLQSTAFESLKNVIDKLRSQRQIKVGGMRFTLLHPFPVQMVANHLLGKKGVTVLEPLGTTSVRESPLFREISSALAQAYASGEVTPKTSFFPWQRSHPQVVLPRLYNGFYDPHEKELAANSLNAVFENMFPEGAHKTRFFLGVDFIRTKSHYPKQEILLQTLQRTHPELKNRTLTSPQETTAQTQVAEEPLSANEPSLAIRQYKDQGPPYTQLSSFFDRVSYFSQTHQQTEWVADPFQAIAAMPPASAYLNDVSSQRKEFPEFISTQCTGCGQCFLHCPHIAIPPKVLPVETILRTAVNELALRGSPVTQLVPLLKNLAKLVNRILKKSEEPFAQLNEALLPAFDRLIDQMKLDTKRLQVVKQDFAAVLGVLDSFPMAITESFFEVPEKQMMGKGNIFFLTLNPALCTGCGVCASVCSEKALIMKPQTAETLVEQQRTFKFWEVLPDTSMEIIQTVYQESTYPSLAAIMLGHNFYMSMAGGQFSNEGGPQKTLIHLITATVESLLQPPVLEQVHTIDTLIEKLSKQVHHHLAEQLPNHEFASLSIILAETASRHLTFDSLIQKLGKDIPLEPIDVPLLQRKVSLIQSLKELRWLITEGPTGVGRARFGLTLNTSHTKTWANEYPNNLFCCPVLAQWSDATPDLIIGLFQGHLSHFLESIRLIRYAQLEADHQYNPDTHDRQLTNLSWHDLTDQERAAFPPFFLVGDTKALIENSLSSWEVLLSSSFPIHIVIYDNPPESSLVFPETQAKLLPRMALFSMLYRNTLVLQSSLATPDHLYSGLVQGIQQQTPSLFHLYTPSPTWEEPDRQNWLTQAQMALKSRTLPALRFDPNSEGVFGTRLSLQGNPEPERLWMNEILEYEENGKHDTLAYTITFADWAFTQPWFCDHFTPGNKEENLLPLGDYLKLESLDRTKQVPCICYVDEQKGLRQLKVSDAIVRASLSIQETWSLLQELSGLVTPFTTKIRETLQQEFAEKQESTLAALREEHAAQIQNQEANAKRLLAQKLRDRLLVLSGYE